MHVKIIDIIGYICEKRFGNKLIDVSETGDSIRIEFKLSSGKDLIIDFKVDLTKYDMSGKLEGILDCYTDLTYIYNCTKI